MSESQIFAMLDHIKDVAERTEKKLDEHIVRDEISNRDFLLPLWNNFQQRKGAMAISGIIYAGISGAMAFIVTWWRHP